MGKKISNELYLIQPKFNNANNFYPFFSGCVFHGCPECFPHDRTTTKHPITGHSMSHLHYMTKKRESYLRNMGFFTFTYGSTIT